MEIKIIFQDYIIENINYFSNYYPILNYLKNKIINNSLVINTYNENINIGKSNEVYINISNDGDKFEMVFFDKNNNKKVQLWKPGKLIFLIFKNLNLIEDIKDIDYASYLIGSFFGAYGFELKFKSKNLKIRIDNDFIEGYYTLNYYKQDGSLGHSCMNDKLEIIKIYNLLDDKVKLLKLVDNNNKIWGRCLLWETDKGKYLDRFYSVNGIYIEGFYMYMEKKHKINLNYLFLKNNFVPLKVEIDISSVQMKTELLDISLKELKDMFDYIYFDTMNFTEYNTKENTIILSNVYYSSKLKSTELVNLFISNKYLFFKFNFNLDSNEFKRLLSYGIDFRKIKRKYLTFFRLLNDYFYILADLTKKEIYIILLYNTYFYLCLSYKMKGNELVEFTIDNLDDILNIIENLYDIKIHKYLAYYEDVNINFYFIIDKNEFIKNYSRLSAEEKRSVNIFYNNREKEKTFINKIHIYDNGDELVLFVSNLENLRGRKLYNNIVNNLSLLYKKYE